MRSICSIYMQDLTENYNEDEVPCNNNSLSLVNYVMVC